jgi:osmotically-inducible protein OsmY
MHGDRRNATCGDDLCSEALERMQEMKLKCFPLAAVILFFAVSMAVDGAELPGRKARAESQADRQMRERIERRLFISPLVNHRDVHVRVRARVVVLSGELGGWDGYGAAIEKALECGAERVYVRLTVRGFSHRHLRGETYEARLKGRSRAARTQVPSDIQLQKQIERQMTLSPFVDGQGVTVVVRNGTAVLSGRVDDWSSHGGATENAFEGGALVVRNLLKVDPSQ